MRWSQMSVVDDRETVEDLQRIVYHYRMAGETVDSIAEKLNIRINQVVKYHRAYMVRLAKAGEIESVDHAKLMELDRLDTLMRAHWPMATEDWTEDVLVGSGPHQHLEAVTRPPSERSARLVLDVIKQRARLRGWDVTEAVDAGTVQNILIVGNNQKAYLEAMLAGRQHALDSGHTDNVLEGETEEASP